ncbi:unnamed protein product [Diamesa hyperborea]
MDKKYLIASIGRKVSTENIEDEPTFMYNSQQYVQLIIWEKFKHILTTKKDTGFIIKPFLNIETSKEYLNLYYDAKQKSSSQTNHFQKSRLIHVFFEIIPEIDETSCEVQNAKEPSVNEFYEALRKSHDNDDLSGITECVQHPSLKPMLRPYQVQGVRWMLKKELKVEYVDQEFVKMKIRHVNSDQIFFYNIHTNELFDSPPAQQLLPKGSLLCDEMGLGKTVEMLDLILMNPRRNLKRKHDHDSKEEVNESLCNDESMNNFKPKLKCICGKSSMKEKHKLLTCSKCKNLQHERCVNNKKDQLTSYICPNCWKSSNTIVDSGCTIIVTPSTIKHQWKDEITKHICKSNFKVLIYEGLSKGGWISPMELKDYDVIITDYNILKQELHYFKSQGKSLRRESLFDYPPCPLVSIKWWRVVLDEVQLVENKNNAASKMVQHLPANYRWGITGTPIEKDSVACLSGLLYFIDYAPYSNNKTFEHLWKQYQSGNRTKLIKVLSHVMWRTSKKDVEDEINIPKQTEVMHYVDMSDLQSCYYKSVHNETQPAFQQNVRNYISRNRIYDDETNDFINDESLLDTNFYKLNNYILRVFLEPLRKLRQDSTIPNLLLQNSEKTEKQTLRPEQLAEHLITKTSIECKSALRTICSSLNGVAALMIAEEKYEEAVKLYKNVIQMAKEYTGVVCVDSMLQIHVYHNLMYINEITKDEEELKNKQHYMEELDKLAWKYIGNYYDKVKEIDLEIVEQNEVMKKACNNMTDRTGEWWRHIIYSKYGRGDDQKILDLVNIEIDGVETDISTKRFTSIQGMDYVLTEWFEKILGYQKQIEIQFSKLEFLSKRLKPANEMDKKDQLKVSQLAVSALNCHLNLLNDKNNVQEKLCVLCELQIKLNEYECLLFDKVLTKDTNEGTWNPRFEEKLLKTLYTYGKRQNLEDVEMGSYFFKFLEALKSQFKLKSKLWMEINYTVSAFDELNMCKIRLEVVEQSEFTKDDVKNNLKISRLQINEQMQEFYMQKQEAEVNFVRLNGRLKYVKYLKENNDPKQCPICEMLPKERYYVQDCGHNLCFSCFKMMTAKNPQRMTCPICRAVQPTKNIFAVTCLPQDGGLIGSYSPKIDEIIKSVLKLKEDEPKVKILIFSHWDTILNAIKPGLLANNIKLIHSINSYKFPQEIKAFKLEDFTCLLINLKFAGKGLNLIEATHVFLVEPILNPDDEMQAVGRIHRIGQECFTFVHRFITKKTIEENIYDKIIKAKDKWLSKDFTLRDIQELLDIKWTRDDEDENLPF